MTFEAASTFAQRVAAIVGGAAIVGTIITFLLRDSETVRDFIRDRAGIESIAQDTNDRIRNVEMQIQTQSQSFASDLSKLGTTLETAISTLNATAETVRGLVDDQRTVRDTERASTTPCMRFEPGGHEVSDAPPGGTIRISLTIRKLRDCGFARHGIWIRNGDAQYHSCEHVSIADLMGRMMPLPPQPEPTRLTFTCTVPKDQGIAIGRAFVWVMPFYEGAPGAIHQPSPEIPFTVLAPANRRN